VIAINQDGTLNSADHPAPRGSIITFFATGIGQTNPPLQDGKIATVAAPVTSGIDVVFFALPGYFIEPAEILYQGAAPGQVAGVYQLNVRIPPDTATGHTWVAFERSQENNVATAATEGIWLQ
jgi:uncharacterized protein (TIGR03437 family)